MRGDEGWGSGCVIVPEGGSGLELWACHLGEGPLEGGGLNVSWKVEGLRPQEILAVLCFAYMTASFGNEHERRVSGGVHDKNKDVETRHLEEKPRK